MAQLDKLLARLGGRDTSVLRLEEDAAAQLDSGSGTQPLTRQQLSGAQVIALLREIATDNAKALLDRRAAATFTYDSGGRAYEIVVTPRARAKMPS